MKWQICSASRASMPGTCASTMPTSFSNYFQDRVVWNAQRELYETRLSMASDKIKEMAPSWYDENALEIGFLGGVVVIVVGGTLVAIAIKN